MKIVALLSGLVASAFAWAAAYFVADLSGGFLAFWPETNSQQLLGLAAWHGFIAVPLIGGIIAIFLPSLGGLLLLAAAGGWVAAGFVLANEFPPQIVVPIALCVVGAIASFGAVIRGVARRAEMRRRRSLAELAREEALRPAPEAAFAEDDEEGSVRPAPALPANDAIRLAATQPAPANTQHELPGLFVANVTVLMLLTIAVGVLFYTNIRSGQLATAFGTLPFAATAGAVPAAAPEDGPALAPVSAPDVAAAPAVTPEAIPEAEVNVSSSPLDFATLPPSDWSDPFAYCAAVRTVDFPDQRYVGPALTEVIASALQVPVSTPPDRARWRCYDGALLGCTSFRGASCAPTPTAAEMRDYCFSHPNATGLQAPNGTWNCVDAVPQVPTGTSWPVDPRGFLPGAWVEITPPGRQVTAG